MEIQEVLQDWVITMNNIVITNAQKIHLMRFQNKKYIDVCTSIGRAFGSVLFPDGDDPKSVMAVMNTFYQWGFFAEEEFYIHGLRYSRLTVNERGKQAILNARVEG